MVEPENEASSELELAHKIAREWADVPAEHLVAILSALEPQLRREHQLKAKQDERHHELEMQRLKEAERRHELDLANLKEREARAAGAYRQNLVGVAAGMAVSLTCIGGAIWLGVGGHYWPMSILVGPVVVVLTKMFVLRKSNEGDVKAVVSVSEKGLSEPPMPMN